MRYEQQSLGFSTADAENVCLNYALGDLVLQFNDWKEAPVCVAFREAIGFRWNDELDDPEHRDDATYRVHDSPWLADQLRLGSTPDPQDFTHYRLCFNACGVLDVLARRLELITE